MVLFERPVTSKETWDSKPPERTKFKVAASASSKSRVVKVVTVPKEVHVEFVAVAYWYRTRVMFPRGFTVELKVTLTVVLPPLPEVLKFEGEFVEAVGVLKVNGAVVNDKIEL